MENLSESVSKKVLEHFMLPSAYELPAGADLIFLSDLSPVHLSTSGSMIIAKWLTIPDQNL